MMLEMADVDFEKLAPQEEQTMLEDYEEVATHLLDSMSFEITDIKDDGSISASLKLIDIEKYISDFLGQA